MRAMAKTPKKLVNFRLPPEVVVSIQEMAEVMRMSQSDVVEQAVVFFETHQGGTEPRVVVPHPVAGPAVATESIPGVVRGTQNLPAVEPKYLRSDGKPMNFMERKRVDEAEHFAKKAASDRGAVATGRDDVDYSVFDE